MRVTTRAFLLGIALLGVPIAPSSGAILGSCAHEDYGLLTRGREVDDARGLRPVRHRTPIYRAASQRKIVGFLDFGDVVYGHRTRHRDGELWVEVDRAGVDRAIGWVPASELLCVDRPLTEPVNGRTRTFFVGARSVWSRAYPSPDERACMGLCTELPTPAILFIAGEDEESGRLLLTRHESLRTDQELLGWVDPRAGVEWHSPFGIRPRDGDEVAYGYASITEAVLASGDTELREMESVARIRGGATWRAMPIRFPVLEIHLPASGVEPSAGVVDPTVRFYAPRYWQPGEDQQLAGSETWMEVWAMASSWEVEAWLSHSELSRWLHLLDLPRPAPADDGAGEQLARALRDELTAQVVGEREVPIGEPLGELLMRTVGLPVSARSPLKNLSLEEIRDLPACAVIQLWQWLETSRELLASILARPDARIRIDWMPPEEAGSQCRGPAGLSLPQRRLSIVDADTSPVDASYDFSYLGTNRFWIPREFLP